MFACPLKTNVLMPLCKKRGAFRQNRNIAKSLKLPLACPFMDLKAWVVFFELSFEFGGGSKIIVFENLPNVATFFWA